MQLVIHSPFRIRLKSSLGTGLAQTVLAARLTSSYKRRPPMRAIVLSLGTQHSFSAPGRFCLFEQQNRTRTVGAGAPRCADVCHPVALETRSRALALPRQRGGPQGPCTPATHGIRKPLGGGFSRPTCLPGKYRRRPRRAPPSPVQQTIEDCLTEAMDINGLIQLLQRIESGAIQCLGLDLPEPSPLAHEILNAKPYAFLDNAAVGRAQNPGVYTRRAGDPSTGGDLGMLDLAAINKVCQEALPRATNPDELHEALLLLGGLTEEEARNLAGSSVEWLDSAQCRNARRETRRASYLLGGGGALVDDAGGFTLVAGWRLV